MADGSDLLDLVRAINKTAVSTIESDGTHAAMFFVQSSQGDVAAHLFEPETERAVGPARATEMARVVSLSDAQAVVVVSEAWHSRADDVPPGGSAGDASRPDDVLFVTGINRQGQTVVLETPLTSTRGRVNAGKTSEYAPEYEVGLFDAVRAVWRSPGSRQGSLSPGGRMPVGHGLEADVPSGWAVRAGDRTIEIEPPGEHGAIHISVFHRSKPRTPQAGDALSMIERFPMWPTASSKVGPREQQERDALVATASCIDSEQGAHWDIVVRLSQSKAIVFTYNDDGSHPDVRSQARELLTTLRVQP